MFNSIFLKDIIHSIIPIVIAFKKLELIYFIVIISTKQSFKIVYFGLIMITIIISVSFIALDHQVA